MSQSRPEHFDLKRFLVAQEPVYAAALDELRRGRKRSHWMWFIFPQISGLGSSTMARHYAIRSLAEAKAYLAHPILGLRLAECTAAMVLHRGQDAESILGAIDAMKLRSSMTLFREAGRDLLFGQCLDAFFSGNPDPATLRLLAGHRPAPS